MGRPTLSRCCLDPGSGLLRILVAAASWLLLALLLVRLLAGELAAA